jgi:hypothetical protein
MYDNAYAAKTKEVMMLSQLMDDSHPLNIDISGSIVGKRGFLSSLSENNDPSWYGWMSVRVVINNCFSEDILKADEKAGYIFKSRIADGTIVAARESVKQLKENGAKFIYMGGEKAKENSTDENSIQTDQPFAEYFQSLLTRDIPLNEILRGNDSVSKLDILRSMDDRCFRDNSFKASDLFWVAGQAAALAIGIKGASIGNTNMTSLAAHSSNAVENTANLANSNGKIVNNQTLSGIAKEVTISMFGVVDPIYFPKYKPRMKYVGHLFPISEVEEHLSHYKVIPYNVKKITSN